MLIERFLYRLKSSGVALRAMFLKCVEESLGIMPARVDGNVCIWKNDKGNKTYYYRLLLLYVHD